ncbi:YhbY family RNA-binding protein [Marispirochaeta sp.]|uniref:YhbY family RNA-binding protein n=1 Tax=Marispirochaeta sp. TaxID=2038653 RepID=UPI0029C93000|nr:YhbY family RNA-binding protein [Marispirochaeta sp.]
MAKELNSAARKFLSARASHKKPVVMLGKEGATPQLIKALNEALTAHELVKLRFVDYKEDRRTIAAELTDAVEARLVRIIGNVAIYFRPHEEPEKRRYTLPE